MNQQLVSKREAIRDDEIDLMELIVIVWRGRYQLLICLLLAWALAQVYIWRQPLLYKLEAQVAHPNSLELAELVVLTLEPKLSVSTQSSYSPKEVFVTAQREILSRATQREFVLFVNEEGTPLNFDWFVGSLKVVEEKLEGSEIDLYSISLSCSDEVWCSDLINDYLNFVREKVKTTLVSNMLALLSSESKRIRETMDYLKAGHQQVIGDRLLILDSQIQIAREMGWHTPNFEVLASDKEVPRYYEGYKLLESERKQLMRQLGSDSHIVGFRDQQRRLARLELNKARITAVKDEVSVLDVVDYAHPAGALVSPNKKMVLIFSIMLGGLVGIFGIFAVHGVKAHRLRTERADRGLSIN